MELLGGLDIALMKIFRLVLMGFSHLFSYNLTNKNGF